MRVGVAVEGGAEGWALRGGVGTRWDPGNAREVPPEPGQNFTVQAAVHWNRLSGETEESPSLEIAENRLVAIPGRALWDDPARAGRLDQMELCAPFHRYPLCDFVHKTVGRRERTVQASDKSDGKTEFLGC